MKEDHHGLKAVCCNGKLSVMLSRARGITGRCFLLKECICWLFSCTELCEMASCSWPDSCSCYGPRCDAAAQGFAEKYASGKVHCGHSAIVFLIRRPSVPCLVEAYSESLA